MSDMAMPQGGMPDMFGPMQTTDPQEVTNALMNALMRIAQDAAAESDTREVKELAQAGLAIAQTLVLLDPGLDPNGVPLEHELQKLQVQNDGAERLAAAKDRAEAKEPGSRRSIRLVKDNTGRVAGADIEG